MTCPNSKHTNLPASARDPCPSSAAGRAGSSGGGLLLLLLCIALFAGPPRSSPPSPAAPPGKPIPMGKPLPPSMGGLPATVSKSSRGPWRLEEGSKKAGKQASTTHDAAHLVGAAYCDVFTCDGDVAEWLGDVRVSLGLRPQIWKKGKSKAEFVRALTHDWA